MNRAEKRSPHWVKFLKNVLPKGANPPCALGVEECESLQRLYGNTSPRENSSGLPQLQDLDWLRLIGECRMIFLFSPQPGAPSYFVRPSVISAVISVAAHQFRPEIKFLQKLKK